MHFTYRMGSMGLTSVPIPIGGWGVCTGSGPFLPKISVIG